MEQEIDLERPTVGARAFHEALQARDWVRAADGLSPDLRVWWPATQEQFSGDRFLDLFDDPKDRRQAQVVSQMMEGLRGVVN